MKLFKQFKKGIFIIYKPLVLVPDLLGFVTCDKIDIYADILVLKDL